MTSAVDICNLALGRIGVSSPISSLIGTDTTSQQCGIFYPQALRTLLNEFDWQFASRRATLALVTDNSAADPPEDYAYSYRAPVNMICPRSIMGASRLEEMPVSFALSSDASGLLLLTDMVDARLRYTFNLVDPTFFTPGFVESLAWRLAVDLSVVLAVTPAMRERAVQQDMLIAGRAAAEAFNSTVEDPLADAESIRARNGY